MGAITSSLYSKDDKPLVETRLQYLPLLLLLAFCSIRRRGPVEFDFGKAKAEVEVWGWR